MARTAYDGEMGGIVITIHDSRGELATSKLNSLRQRAVAAAADLELSGRLSATIVGDSAIQDAHRVFANVSETTDVLTFDIRTLYEQSTFPRHLDCDVLLCFDEAHRQSVARGIPVEQELLLYLVHSMLHCLGYDDHDDAAAAEMHAMEDRVLTAIGVGVTYAAPVRESEGS